MSKAKQDFTLNPSVEQPNIERLLDDLQCEAADRRRALLSGYSLAELAQMVADNSNPLTGDRHIVRYVVAELEARAEWKQHLAEVEALTEAPPELPRRSFLSGLFGAVALAALPWRPLEPARPLHPTVAHWQHRLDAAIAPLEALRDGIGHPITGEQFYALERAVFSVLGELVEAMECGPFNELIIALGVETDYLRAVGILDQYQAEKAEYEAVSRG